MLRVRKSIARWMPFKSRPGRWPVGSNDCRAGGQQHGVEFGASCFGSMNFTWQPRSCMICVMWPAAKSSCLPTWAQVTNVTPSSCEQLDAALDDAFVELHVRNAVHEQPADAIGPFVDGDRVADLLKLRCRREPGRTAADDRHLLAGALRRRLRLRSNLLRSRDR